MGRMKFFVTGVNGQLGHDVMNELNKRGHEGLVPTLLLPMRVLRMALL